MGNRTRCRKQGGEVLNTGEVEGSSPTTSESSGVTGFSHLLALAKENPIPVMLGLLIAQQMGWLSTAATQLHGVCF